MKQVKKLLITLTAMFALCMLFAAGSCVQAADAAPAKSSFSLSGLSSTKTTAYINAPTAYQSEVALCNAKGTVLQTKQCTLFANATFTGLKKNRLYRYKVRRIAYDSSTGTYVAASDWSTSKAFTTANYTVKLVSKKSKTVSFKFPKVSGIKSYVLYMSTSQNKGYKKVATVKPGKTLKISRFKKKAFAYRKNYYYKIVPKATAKVTVDYYINGFYLYQTYA